MKKILFLIALLAVQPLIANQTNYYDLNLIRGELDSRLNLKDEAICIKDAISSDRKEAAAYVVSNLILAYGVMDAFGIRKVHYVGTPGANATGALLLSNYWKSEIN
jgi:hypothetical protein